MPKSLKFTKSAIRNLHWVVRPAHQSVDLLLQVILKLKMKPVYEKGNFNEVQNYIKDIVLEQGKVASMKTLHEIYGLGIGDTRYRSKLKKRIQSSFENQIYFLSSKNLNFAEVIVRSDYLEDAPHYDRNETIRNVAQMLKEDILEKFSNVSEPNWHT